MMEEVFIYIDLQCNGIGKCDFSMKSLKEKSFKMDCKCSMKAFRDMKR